MSNSFISPSAMQKTVAFMAILSLVAIFSTSLWSRVQDPSIIVETRTGPQSQDQAMMAEITALMAEVDRNPENVQALKELAHFFMLMEAWDRAYAFWNRILALEPENDLALNQAGFSLFQLERYPEAVELFESLLEIDPGNYRSHFNLAIIFKYYLDDQQRAVDHFKSILDINPDDEQLLNRVNAELAGSESSTENQP
ncbi:tetratricopeptide repeat protein [Desulfonatronovibrio hydrogenovorans]|uniref:tetratricopeptide repeat protein n=1 Tax=Desulfonatronovibrio hydrogenovorans TaxID=53245 RepID=UPI00048C9E33|nr:tetratricopeptide repeat protein [Desulfonatronovibrio hydrogenovorans]